MSATATKVSNSKLLWIENDNDGKPMFTTDCGRYQVYAGRKGWIPCYWNRLVSPQDWDYCRKEAGKGNTPMSYDEAQQALKAAEDFHFSKTGTKISETNREELGEPSPIPEKKKRVPSTPVESATKTEPTTQESKTVSTSTETVENLTVDRDAALNLCHELGWHTCEKWDVKLMKKKLRNLKKVMQEGDMHPTSEESIDLADKIMTTVEEGGKLLLEGEYPEAIAEVSENGDGREESVPVEKKKRGRKPDSKVKAQKPPKEKKKKKEQPNLEPVDNLALLQICHPEELTLSEVKVDRSYQRGIVEGQVKKILKNFREYSLGSLIAAEREDGSYWVVDGQQRSEALRRKGYTTYHFMVFKSNGPQHEAEVFGDVNSKRKSLLKTEQFAADLTAGESESTNIAQVVIDCGFEFGKSAKGWPKLDCVQSLRKIWRKGGEELLTKTLETLKSAWNENKDACKEFLVFGVADFMHRYAELYDHSRFVKILQELDPTVLPSLIKANNMKKLFGGGRHLALGVVFWERYNKGFRENSKNYLPNKYLGKAAEEVEGPRA